MVISVPPVVEPDTGVKVKPSLVSESSIRGVIWGWEELLWAGLAWAGCTKLAAPPPRIVSASASTTALAE
ncbi:hypothetical protein KIM372_12900 [Bombiscardovia nodaiensis]|uniref:Uncharacterized protein n=1 Tax=Bombiscardovia nodaiensis TaxID=2932181 RepID=A0ABM8B9V8_9BIFI|nr:hypothetical protein KIM372_12900 [Bombiscardovia nodaiensis]